MKDFCGSFDDRCTVTVHVVQSSADLYPKELSGQKLPTHFIVERTAFKTGRSELKIKDTSGKILSKKKEDLDDIKQHMNLQVDNPAVVLHQSHAKEFLKNAEPKEFYSLFMKATRMDVLEEKFRDARRVEEDLRKVQDDQTESYETWKEKKFKPAEQAWTELENVREIEIKMRGVKYERCSRFVLDQQAKIEKFEHDGENAKDDKQKKETKLAQLEASIVSEKDGIRDLEDEVKSHQPRQKRIMEECNQVEAEVREAQKAVSKKENEKKKALRDIAHLKNEIEGVKQRARSQLAEAAALKKKKQPGRPVSQKQELESKLEEVQNKLDEALADKHRLDDEDRKFGRELDDSRQRFKVMDEEVRKHQQNLDRLSNVDKGNPLARFGKDVPAIANAFKAAEKSFPKGKAPIGPVGAFIKMKDPKWGLALVDATLRGRGHQTWLIHSEKDSDTCRKILKDKKIYDNDANFRAVNTDDFEVRVGSAPEPTILDVIEIDHADPDVKRYIRNYLVDAFALNELRLAETFEAAKRVVERPIETVKLSNGVKHELRRVCYNLNNEKTAIERKQSTNKTGSVRSDGVFFNSNPYSVDVSGEKNRVTQQLSAAQEARAALRTQVDAVHASKDSSAKAVMAVMKEIKAMEKQRKDLEHKIQLDEETQAQWRDADGPEEDLAIAALEDLTSFNQEEEEFKREIESRKNDVEGISNLLQQLVEEVRGAEERKKEAEERKRQIQNEVKEVESRLKRTFEDVSEKNDKIEACKKLVEKSQQKADKALQDKEAAEQHLKQIEAAIPASYEWKGPVKTDRTADQIDKEIEHLEKQKQKGLKNRNFDQVQAEFHAAKRQDKEFQRRFDELNQMIESIKRLKKGTRTAMRKNKDWNKNSTRFTFNRNLNQKGFNGTVIFDDKKREMDPVVRTQNVGDQDQEVDIEGDSGRVPVKQLSGGERSYSTLCLLLALKEATQSPFLALDEVDVFMDERNRRVALELLTKVLTQHNDAQTIIISPLSLATIDSGPKVNIKIMHPIDRTQQRLPFSAADQGQGQ